MKARSGLKAPAEPSCRPTKFIFQYHHLWRFFKNKYYLKPSHRLKAISGTLIIIVNSYNLDLIAISFKLIKMSINRPGCGLQENDDFRKIKAFLSKIPLYFFLQLSFIFRMFAKLACRPLKLLIKSTETLIHSTVAFRTPASNKMAIKSKLLLFTVIIIVPLIDFSLCDDIK